jgi:hypothetical protein
MNQGVSRRRRPTTSSAKGTASARRALMKVRFLLDERMTPRLRTALTRRDPSIDVLRVGDA